MHVMDVRSQQDTSIIRFVCLYLENKQWYNIDLPQIESITVLYLTMN